MNGYKIVLLKAIFMLYRLPESERVCSGICNAPTDEQMVGTGLGLKIVKDIIVYYKGKIYFVPPEENFSTCFRIELPKQ